MCFYILYVFFVSPHDAFMHHTMHVLDAPENLDENLVLAKYRVISWQEGPLLHRVTSTVLHVRYVYT